jgi:hypothetical protein
MKKNKKKVIVISLPKAPKLKLKSLDFDDEKENLKILNALQSLIGNPGWVVFRQILEKNVSIIEKQIITKVGIGEDGKTVRLDDKQVDELRDKYEIFIEVMNKPENLIKVLIPKEQRRAEENHDPYE